MMPMVGRIIYLPNDAQLNFLKYKRPKAKREERERISQDKSSHNSIIFLQHGLPMIFIECMGPGFELQDHL